VDASLIVVFVLLGAIVGLLAGLLGIGGGMTMVPFLTIIFTREGFPPDHIVHMAVATSTATIMFTSISSAREHHRHGAVLWSVVAGLAPGIIVGSLLGPQIVGGMSTAVLAGFFGVFVAFSATQMLLDRKPAPTRELPGKPALFGVGSGIGLVSSMVGAGGGFLSVPFMTWCNVRIHNAVATSAALGLPIAVAGTVGYVLAGLRQAGMPPYTIGYIYAPALLAIVAASVLSAPIGAGLRTAGRWAAQARSRSCCTGWRPTCCGSHFRLGNADRRAAYENISRRTFFWTLPIALRGSSSTKCTRLGTLKPAICAFSDAITPFSVSAWSDRATTTAVTASPKSGSGTPITADSTTSGSASIFSSISFG
jgi:uncharacterized membrane protein YfcA